MATYDNWREAVNDLRNLTRKVTTEQQKLATNAGVRLPKNLPQLVAAARLKAALAAELCLPTNVASSEGQLELLYGLDAKRACDPLVRTDQGEAGAWILFHLLMRRQQSLERLRLMAGDIVEVKDSVERRLGEVVSISSEGRVLFKGGQGAGAWPDRLKVLCRKEASTHKSRALKKDAANQAAARSKSSAWSHAKESELAEYKVDEFLNPDDVDHLQQIIDSATDEKPIQKMLEARPQILAALLTGINRYSVPRPHFGKELIPDFLLADVDSLGIRWLLVELETPASSVTLQNAKELEKHARGGVSQVHEWREWILNNLDKARRSRSEGGLGLVDIRPQSEGVVLVGRRKYLQANAKAVRNTIREGSNIRVHTYDWLIESLKGVLTFGGPPVLSPYSIQPLREDRDAT